jgi:hypothetical protein
MTASAKEREGMYKEYRRSVMSPAMTGMAAESLQEVLPPAIV